MNIFIPILEKCALFQGVSSEDIQKMLRCFGARIAHFGKYQFLFSEGDEARYVGIVLTGGVRLVKEDYDGKSSIISLAGPGELFCESFACADVAALPVGVEAAENSAVVLIDSRRITSICANACGCHSKVLNNLLRVVASRNLEYHHKMEITAKRTTREKLMAYLLAQSKAAGSNTFTIPFDRQALADYLQVERSAMSTEIGKLRDDGVLITRRSEFTLLLP